MRNERGTNVGGYQRKDFIERIRASADIVSTISDYTPLKRSGRRYKALCPFHSEKTPSFMVDQEKQLFHCFGCGEGGDIFKFIMLHDKVEFMDAARILAARWGIEEPQYSGSEKTDNKEQVFKVVAEAESFFVSCLRSLQKGNRGRDYLKKRGIDPGTVETLKIGYVPDEWESLTQHLRKVKSFPLADIITAGLSIQRTDGTAYDRFRNRLMFPIRNLSGRTVAFGGRVLGESEEAKYINSPDTPIYAKSFNLYGLNLTGQEIKKAGNAILVEGYLDFAALYEAGVRNCVASLGTSLTTGHAGLLRRFTDTVIVSYDPDSAGRAASIRSLDLLLERGMKTKVMVLPEGKDPDKFIREDGVQAYRAMIDSARSYIDFLIGEAVKGKNLKDASAQVAVINEIIPHITVIESPIERSRYIPAICDALKIEDHVLLDEIKRIIRKGREKVNPQIEASLTVKEAESSFIALMIEDEECRNAVIPMIEIEDFQSSGIREIVDVIVEMHGKGKPIDYSAVSDNLPSDLSRKLLRIIAFEPKYQGGAEDACECINSFKLSRLKAERLKVQKEMERTDDQQKLSQLMRMKMQISKQIDALS